MDDNVNFSALVMNPFGRQTIEIGLVMPDNSISDSSIPI